jgi:uncharacterized protein YqjF (DUF2071 family)
MTVRRFLTAEWRNLLMINWEVPPDLLSPYLPKGTKLDTFCGRNYVSIVGFQFLNTRLLGMPIPFHCNFEEVNLRFYVTREVNGEVRRGVVFVRELVPRFWIAATAKIFYNEPYKAVAMRHKILHSEQHIEGTYEWHYRDWHTLSFSTSEPLEKLVPDSIEQFIAEHYWGYCMQRNKRVVEYRVEHPAWSVRKKVEVSLRWDPSTLYGDTFGAILNTPYQSAFIAEGSPVSVYWPAMLSG